MRNRWVARVMPEQKHRPARGQTTVRPRISAHLAASPGVWRLAALGFAAKGVLYVIAGGTVAWAALTVGGRAMGTRGALRLLVALPLGRLLVAVVAVGLCGSCCAASCRSLCHLRREGYQSIAARACCGAWAMP